MWETAARHTEFVKQISIYSASSVHVKWLSAVRGGESVWFLVAAV